MRRSTLMAIAVTLPVGGAFAADLPKVGAPDPRPPESGTNWDGIYIGLNTGAAWSGTDWSSPTGSFLLSSTPRFPSHGTQLGLLGGLTLGYNHQSGPWVLGVEGDVDVSSLYGNAVCGGVHGAGGAGWACTLKTDVLASLDARAGYAFGPALLYLKGGLAYAHDQIGIGAYNANGYAAPNPAVGISQDRFGLSLGAGMEYALADGWSAKAEYGYYGFGKRSFGGQDPSFATTYGASVGQDINLIKFGLNYRWGAGAGKSAAVPVVVADLFGEFGVRAGWSSGKYKFDLYDPFTTSDLNSRLTWPGSGLLSEGFARINHASGFFAKGFVGGVILSNGTMHDEDFPPGTTPYTNTISSTQNSSNIYGTIDLGFAYDGGAWRAGPFVGYNYFSDRQNAYGCTQTAPGGTICTPEGVVPPMVAANQLTLSRNDTWNSVRLGLAGDVNLTDRFKIAAEAAWVPWTSVDGSFDNHWLRPDINPLADHGHGTGVQLESVLSYLVTDRMTIGLGARYWHMEANGTVQFPGSGVPPSPTNISVDRTMVFGQISYAFGVTSKRTALIARD